MVMDDELRAPVGAEPGGGGSSLESLAQLPEEHGVALTRIVRHRSVAQYNDRDDAVRRSYARFEVFSAIEKGGRLRCGCRAGASGFGMMLI